MKAKHTGTTLRGKKLDRELVDMARKEELEEYVKRGVYEKVLIEECWQATGKRPIGVRWGDVNRGDEIHPEVRSRLVDKATRKGKNVDLFSATPPIEASNTTRMPTTLGLHRWCGIFA